MSINNSFQRLKNRPISNDERLILHELKETYGIEDDDPMWSIIFAFAYHLELYKKIPAEIESERKRTLEETRHLSEEIARATAGAISKKQMVQLDKKIDRAFKKVSTGLTLWERIFYSTLSSITFMVFGALIMLLLILYVPGFLSSVIEFLRGAGK